MSRIGKRTIPVPAGVEIKISDDAVVVKGKNGELTRPLHSGVSVVLENNEITVSPKGKSRLSRALWGTYAAHVKNMIHGVTESFVKKLSVEGIGYKAEVTGSNIKLQVGFSHPVLVPIPQGITVAVEKNIITVTGADKDKVGQFAASVRLVKKPEPYKGKGIRYEGEVVRMKEGKKVAA